MRLSNSSSPRIASCKCLGVIRLTFKSLDAFPANSNTCNLNVNQWQVTVETHFETAAINNQQNK